MKTPALLIVVAMMILPLSVMGITPVHNKVIIDTTQYENSDINVGYFPGPVTWGRQGATAPGDDRMIVKAFLKKNTNQYDFYSFSGKIGTSVVPKQVEPSYRIDFSCTMLDDDASWESLVTCYRADGRYFFKVFDDDGTELLADSGRAYYGFDGNSTFIVTDGRISFDSWRFRTNLSTESPKSLAKTKSIQSSPMQIYGLSGGDYRVTLTPSSGNQINFQMFDLLGRCVFDKQIENLTSPVSFTVPESNVPNSPFIAKVNDGNGSVVKKQITVK